MSQNYVKMRNRNFRGAKRREIQWHGSFKRLQLSFWYFIPHETYRGHRAEAKNVIWSCIWFYLGYKDKTAIFS